MKDALATLKTASGDKSGYPLRSALVRHHRPARRRQDHGAGEFRAEISARARRDARGDRGRRRHALLRLVVHRRGRADRHRRPLHDAGFRRKADKESWLAFLDLLKKNRSRQPINGVLVAISVEDLLTLPKQELAASRRRHPGAPARTASAAQGRLPGLCAIYQGRPGRRLHRVFRLSRRGRPPAGLGRDVPDRRQDAESGRGGAGRVRPLLERLSEETLDRLQDEPAPQHRVQLFGFPAQMARAQAPDPRLPQPDLRADALSRQREPARLLLHLGHPAGHADRPVDRLAGAHVRRRGGRFRILFRHRQELLPGRSHFQGHHRRGRLGLDRSCRGAPRADPQDRGPVT